MKNVLKKEHSNKYLTHFKAMLLAAVVLLGTLAPSVPTKAAVWEDYKELDGFYYEVMDDGNVNILGYAAINIEYDLDERKSLTIPKELDGKKVTRISSYQTRSTAESCFHGLKEIIIPDTVTYIDDCAFFSCYELENIEIPDSVTEMGSQIFGYCTNLKSVTLPGVKVLHGSLFNKSGLEEVVVSEGTEILYGSFYGCSKLKKVTLPSTLKRIDTSSFTWCNSLKKLTIPKGVTYIGESSLDTFGDDGHLTDIYYEGTKTQWEKIDNKEAKYIERDGVKVHFGKAVPETVKLSETSYTYDGKAKKPTVIVKDSNGKTVNKKYYTVSYSNNKKVGQATVKVTFKGKYKGTVLKETFKIVPKSTKISKVKAAKKGFTVTWKKQKNQTSGYQIQYSTSSKFKNAKTVTVKKSTDTSKKITKLKANKKYYVRVRTYKTVKINGKSKKVYSAWSAKEVVTTKK